jgi:YD repeat-containing protein
VFPLSSNVQRTFEVDKGIIIACDYDANGNLVYYGQAHSGVAQSEEKWKIRKLSYDANGNLIDWLWAGGREEFTHAWDDRGGLTYL